MKESPISVASNLHAMVFANYFAAAAGLAGTPVLGLFELF